jgi:uracil-DNA glycosylase
MLQYSGEHPKLVEYVIMPSLSTDTVTVNSVRMEASWKQVLAAEFDKDYFLSLKEFLTREKEAGRRIFPSGDRIFAAFDATPFDQVKVVIIGQDPYHGEGQANGLCFSVADGKAKPPSLQNIFKELRADTGTPIPASGNLEAWANRGVLLLNATLTVRAGEAGSHQQKGWEEFTDAAIRVLNERRNGLVFLLWGNYAKAKGTKIDRTRHLVLEAAHPSPLARTGFSGCRHFSKTNAYLRQCGIAEIDWNPANER